MTKYRTKYGLELIGFLFLVFGFIVFDVQEWEVLLALIPLSLLLVLVLYGIRYTIEGEILTVHNSFMPKTGIEIAAIRKINETNNPLSSPAASLDRLEIFYNTFDSIIISPAHTEDFLNDLLAVNKEIEIKRKPGRSIFSKLAL